MITYFDAYGHPIGLTYQNKKTFKSALGGGVTIIARLGIFVFLILEIINVINKQNETEYVFDQNSYDLAVQLNYMLGDYNGIKINEVLFRRLTHMGYVRKSIQSYQM
eukprot:403364511